MVAEMRKLRQSGRETPQPTAVQGKNGRIHRLRREKPSAVRVSVEYSYHLEGGSK